jgi:hypothetical protein
MISFQIGPAARTAVTGFPAEFFTVDRLGKELGDCRLAGAARAGEKVGVRDLSVSDGVDECFDDVFLSDDLRKLGGPVCSVKYLVCHISIITQQNAFFCSQTDEALYVTVVLFSELVYNFLGKTF